MTETPLSDDSAAQADVIAFLSDSATHGGAPVETVVTHISRVFLAGDTAWKLKRAVRTNYLDFSTPALRAHACLAEIAVNAEAAGRLYRGVTAITREARGGLALGGAGTPVDWVVEMRRFDRRLEFDRLLQAGRLGRTLVERLADILAQSHAHAPDARRHGGADATCARIDQIAEAAAAADPAFAEIAAAWGKAARAEAAARARLLDIRARRGCVRRCHGDLHLRNIVLLDGRPTPFDAIEFSEEIASIDVLYDLALTLVDLILRDRTDLANALLSRWLGATRDASGLALLPLWLSMRGAVRGMVAASSGRAEEAETEFALALRTLRRRPPPRLVCVGGMSGAGKSSLARLIAPRIGPAPGAVDIRSDVERKRLFGVAPETRLPLAAYAPDVSERVMRRMLGDARRALAAGAPVVLDATFLDPATRAGARALAARAGVRFDGLWLTLPLEEAERRIAARPRDASDADAEVVRGQVDRAAPPPDWAAIDAGGGLEDTLAAAVAALR